MTTSLLNLDPHPTPATPPRHPRHCATPGCAHLVTEPWEDSGLLCYECAIEGELYDRDARWDHVCPIPGTHCLPCDTDDERRRELDERKGVRLKH